MTGFRYMKNKAFPAIGTSCGVRMKKPHTIIEKWPMKLKLQPGQVGAKEKFDVLLSSGHGSFVRYVEWAKTK